MEDKELVLSPDLLDLAKSQTQMAIQTIKQFLKRTLEWEAHEAAINRRDQENTELVEARLEDALWVNAKSIAGGFLEFLLWLGKEKLDNEDIQEIVIKWMKITIALKCLYGLVKSSPWEAKENAKIMVKLCEKYEQVDDIPFRRSLIVEIESAEQWIIWEEYLTDIVKTRVMQYLDN